MKKIIGILIVTLMIGTALPSMSSSVEKNVISNDIPSPEFVPGDFIVKFKDREISSLSIDSLNEKYKVCSMEKAFRNAENTILDNIYILRVPENSDILAIVDDYASLPNVMYAEPNYIGYLLSVPNDEYFGIQWGLHNIGQVIWDDITGASGADIDAPDAWDIETGSEEIVIAIIDTGVDYTHPDLAANIWINEDEIPDNGIDDDENGYIDDIRGYDFAENNSDPLDRMDHGTHCAGIAAAIGNNGIGVAGVSWNCKIMPVKVFGDNGNAVLSNWSTGMKYAADNGADVFSMSIGGSGNYFMNLLKDVMDYAYSKDVVLVAAAGNEGKSRKCYPSGYDNVISVAAINQNNERCTKEDWDPDNRYFWIKGSQWGYWVDVAAPGNLVYSTMPTYHVSGNDDYNPNTGQNWTQNYDFMWGTSMACPHVAGLAALLLSQDPTLTNEEVRLIIRANVDSYDSEEYIGTGRINAYKALTRYNNQPEKPETPTGETSGKPGREYSFTTSATDSDDDELYYFWDWGDENYSEWLGPFNSGDTCEASYTWQQEANFSIKVKVKDGKGGESYWSEEFIFSTPKNKIFSTPFLRFLENHPHLFPLLRQLLGL